MADLQTSRRTTNASQRPRLHHRTARRGADSPWGDGAIYHGGGSWQAVSPGYFEALRIPVVRGRGFSDRDVRPNPAVVCKRATVPVSNVRTMDPVVQRSIAGPRFRVIALRCE